MNFLALITKYLKAFMDTRGRFSSILNPVYLLMVLITAACSGDLSYEEALQENRENIDDQKTVQDANFLVEAKSLNLLGQSLSTLAADSAYSTALSDFAKTYGDQNEQLADDIKDLAKDKDIKLPAEMSEEHKAIFYQLSSSNRSNFDRTFIDLARRINEETRVLYTRNATEANDPDIRAFAARKLDQLKAHMAEARKVEEQLLQTSPTDNQP